MNRRIVALTIAAVVALGLTACSGGSDDAPSSEPAATSAPAEDTSTEQTVADACVSMAGPLQEEATTISEVANAASDPQSAVDAWTANVDAFRTVSESVTNPEVKAAATAVYEDTAAMSDAIAKIYVDGDTGAVTELTTATTDMQTSYIALNTLCAG